MQSKTLISRLWLCLIVLLSTSTTNAQSWSDPVEIESTVTGTGGDIGQHTSQAIINSNPAICYYDNTRENLMYMRATNTSGTAWGTPVIIDAGEDVGKYSSMAVVNGNPAIAYYDHANGDLKYVRAYDASGTTWGTPITLDATGFTGLYTSLLIVNGNPAISYNDGTNGDLKYIRATNANGTTWGSAVTVASTDYVGLYTSMIIANGNPAIAYQDLTNFDLKYVRAIDASGAIWGTPVTVDATGKVGLHINMALVDSNPAIAYYDETNTNLKYVRASNASGSTWGTPIALDTTGNVGTYPHLTIVGNRPAISYFDGSSTDLAYIRSSDSIGTSWGTPITVDTSGIAGQYTSMVIANGNPAIAYYDYTNKNLKYVRATNSNGSTWNSPISFDANEAVEVLYTSTAVANGNPAMSYYDTDSKDLMYVRATNANGTAWGTPITVDATGDVGQYADMIMVNDTPVIAYYDATNANVKFVQANNKEGSSWGTPIAVQYTGSVGRYTRLTIVNSKPAIIYLDLTNTALEYVLADNISGTGWGTPVAIATLTSGFETDPSTSMAIVNGNPAVAFYNKNTGDLGYVRASSTDGSTWNSSTIVYSTNDVGKMPSLAVVNGNPAISFYDATNTDLLYVRATNANGTAWGTPIKLDSTGNVGAYPRLAIINGKPAVAYYGTTSYISNLKYIRASNASGTSWGTSLVLDDNYKTFYPAMNVSGSNVHVCYFSNYTTKYIKGATGTTWNGSTWSSGTPTSSTVAEIASSTAPSSFSCGDLVIQAGVALNTSTSNIANIYGNITNYGDGVTGTGELQFKKAGRIELMGNTIEHEGTIHVLSGCTLQTNDRLRISSNSSNTGRIAWSQGAISGNVMVQRYIPAGNRAFRFFGHPFDNSMALSQLTDEIDITGNGGTANGFTTTTTNKPSAFWFDVTIADTATSGANTGWTAFTSATTNSWDQYELLRLLIRGAKGEGLTGGSYAPSAATFEATGEINQGTQVITLTKGSSSTFVGCGNPFPDGVQMNALSKGSNVGANYYVWDATSGTKGAYVTNAFSLSYVLPSWGAFFTTVSANSNNTITFEEVDKSSGGASIFKTTGVNDWVELYIYDSTTKWDRLLINLNSNGMEVEDKLDGKKLYNPNLDFFTLSKDDVRLAVDVRPYEDQKSIPLGLTAYNRYNRYVIRTGMFNIPAGTKLMLHDKYLNKQEELKAGGEYWFDVTTDTLTQGNNRFEINMVGKPTNIIEATDYTAQIHLIPNPAYNEVKVSFDKIEGEGQITMMSVTGQVVYQSTIDTETGSVKIDMSNVLSGIYIVELQSKNGHFTEKLIKE